MSDRRNTIFGWILGSAIVALLLRFFISLVMPLPEPPAKEGFFIKAAAPGGGAAKAGPSFATLLATGSAAKGKAIFAKCMACHTIAQGAPNAIGPNLYGVIGEPIGKGKNGYAFSSALSSKGGDWTYDELNQWLTSPRSYVPGTKMSFAGLSKPQDRADVILYLRENGGGPPLPKPAAASAAGGGATAGGDSTTALAAMGKVQAAKDAAAK